MLTDPGETHPTPNARLFLTSEDDMRFGEVWRIARVGKNAEELPFPSLLRLAAHAIVV